MKQLMLGNKAVARGLYEAGVLFASSYPGTPSTEITEELAKYDDLYSEWAPNEKVAMEAAFGASLAGRRSFCAMKHVGLNVAADPLYTMSYTGVNAGLVIAVADDAGMHSSQNEQDSRHHAIAAKVPMLEPSDSAESLAFAKLAFEISEEFDTPVLLKMCTRVAHSQSVVETGERTVPTKTYEKNIAKYVMMPGMAKKRHPIIEERTRKLIDYAESSGINRVEAGGKELGIITCSTSYEYVKEVFGDSVSILKLGMTNPLPVKLIRDFAASVEKLVVVEELDPIIENHVRSLGLSVSGKDVLPVCGEFSQNLIAKALGGMVHTGRTLDEALPMRPPVMCPGCPHRGLFFTLKKLKATVLGDIGCYTLGAVAPLSSVDSVIDMGASLSMAHGMELAGAPERSGRPVVGVIGDSTFAHSGITSLLGTVYNGGTGTLCILDNRTTAMTGTQGNPVNGVRLAEQMAGVSPLDAPAGKQLDLVRLCEALGVDEVEQVDAQDLKEVRRALKEATAHTDRLSVIIFKSPCRLIDRTRRPAPTISDCRACGTCIKIGCPALGKDADGRAVIDTNQCIGCDQCAQSCPFDCIKREA